MKLRAGLGVLLLVVTGHSTAAWSCDEGYDSDTYDTLAIQWLSDANAVCNDGSPGAFYYKLSNSNSTTWLVYLGGGGMCYDADSCAARWNGTGYPQHDCDASSASAPCFMSSKDYQSTCSKTGIFDADPAKSPLADANKIYLPYCTSDFHVGSVGAGGSAVPDFSFHGADMVTATLADLSTSLGLAAGHTLLFAGGSAGGRGAMAWLDIVPSLVPEGVTVLGLLDSGYYLDVAPFAGSAFGGFQVETKLIGDTFNGNALVDRGSPECAAAYWQKPWKCLYGQFRMPFISTPALMTAAQYDGWQLSHDVHDFQGIEADPTFTANESEYVDAFGAATRALAATLPSPASSAVGASVYSTACYNHHITEKPEFWTTATDSGVTQADALAAFLNDPSQVRTWIDACSGYNCGTGC